MSQITDTYDLANNRYLNTNYHLTINTYLSSSHKWKLRTYNFHFKNIADAEVCWKRRKIKQYLLLFGKTFGKNNELIVDLM